MGEESSMGITKRSMRKPVNKVERGGGTTIDIHICNGMKC